MPNILTPIDMLGSLLTPRGDGETLASYRERVLGVAREIARRDVTTDDWLATRSREMSAHVGEEVQLKDGSDDLELLEQAAEQLLTYDKLSDWEGTFRWPEYGAPGEPAYYNFGSTQRGGVASSDALAFSEEGGRLVLTPGFVATGGKIYYVPGDLRQLHFDLPPNTKETVILPWQITSDHGHAISVVDENTLQLKATDHTHTARLTPEETLVIEEAGGHTHEARPVEMGASPTFVMTGPSVPLSTGGGSNMIVHPGRELSFSGAALPVLQLEAVEVSTDDDAHTSLVDPYDYWSGTFTIGDADHIHVVEDWEVQEAKGHTHTITKPTLPEHRLLVPLFVQHEEMVFEESTYNPFTVELITQKGWTVARLPQPETGDAYFSDRLTIAYDAGGLVQGPQTNHPGGTVIGLGPEEPASSLHFQETRVDYVSAEPTLRLQLRAEDSGTGGVPYETVEVTIRRGSFSATQNVVTDSEAHASATFALPPDLEGEYRIEATFTSGETRAWSWEVDASNLHGYGTFYGSPRALSAP